MLSAYEGWPMLWRAPAAMPAVAARTLTLTPEEYFAWEETQTVRHEYHFGEVFPMPGGTFAHATLIANLTIALGVALRGSACRVVSEAMRLQVLASGQYVYADASVVCGAPEFATDRPTTLTNPVLVCEVLSDETRAYDLDAKFALYRGVPSVRAVLFAEPERRWIRLARRTETGWVLDEPVSEGAVTVEAIGATLALDDLYEGL